MIRKKLIRFLLCIICFSFFEVAATAQPTVIYSPWPPKTQVYDRGFFKVDSIALFNSPVGIGQASPVHLLDMLQTVSGSSAKSALNISSTWNTSGILTAFNLNVTNTASGAGSNVVSITENGLQHLVIPTGTAQVLWKAGGLQITQPGGAAGGISLNNTNPNANQLTVGVGFAFATTGQPAPTGGNEFMYSPFGCNNVSGVCNSLLYSGSFTPVSGTGQYNDFQLSSAFNQTGGANGITRSLYINPTLTSVTDYRAIEVATGKSILQDVSVRHLTGNTSTPGITAGPGAGTSPTISVIGTDLAGYISITTGSTPSASATLATIAFNVTYTAIPRTVILTAANANAAALTGTNQVFVAQANIVAANFPITTGSAALAGATAYVWYYQVIQ